MVIPSVFLVWSEYVLPEFFLVLVCLCSIQKCFSSGAILPLKGGIVFEDGFCDLTPDFLAGLKAFFIANVATLRFTSNTITIYSHIDKTIIKDMSNGIALRHSVFLHQS